MSRSRWLLEAEWVDRSVYCAIANTDTPLLDDRMNWLARAADYSRLSLFAAALLASTRGVPGRLAAGAGLASVGATSAIVNLVIKPLGRRGRPDPEAVSLARRVPMPRSGSFPSGHAAAAFAFATGVGRILPREAVPLRVLAALVAYSRVHTGVHYPGDVVAGSLLGGAIAQLTTHAIERVIPYEIG